jgi:hypothetical protein
MAIFDEIADVIMHILQHAIVEEHVLYPVALMCPFSLV